MKDTTLLRFLKDQCANYDQHYSICLTDDAECDVLAGKRCGYFEKAVLGPPDYKFRLPGYDYAKLFGQYAEQTKAEKQQVVVRRCGCGSPLRHRQRYCPDCTLRRRQNTKRQSQRKRRKSDLVERGQLTETAPKILHSKGGFDAV